MIYTTIQAAYRAYAALFEYAPYLYDNQPIWAYDEFTEYIEALLFKRIRTFPLTDIDIKRAYSISLND